MPYYCPECGDDHYTEPGICEECQIPLKFMKENKEYGEDMPIFRDEFRLNPFSYAEDDLKLAAEEEE